MGNLIKTPIYIKNGDLVFYKYTLPEDNHTIVYRGVGYIDEANIDGTPWICKILIIDLVNPFNEYDKIEVFYKTSIIKNFGNIEFNKFIEDFPEWQI